ncbi:Uncharacterized protein PBTT_04164 [Plasmodiophora brassicae]
MNALAVAIVVVVALADVSCGGRFMDQIKQRVTSAFRPAKESRPAPEPSTSTNAPVPASSSSGAAPASASVEPAPGPADDKQLPPLPLIIAPIPMADIDKLMGKRFIPAGDTIPAGYKANQIVFEESIPDPKRHGFETGMFTMDFNPSRVTIKYNADYIVTQVTKG